jgi:aspartate carbamoyltransferase catalytic subunit
MFKDRDIISIKDLSRKEIEHIFSVADKMEVLLTTRTECSLLEDRILATLFFEPSTRTRLSFEAAMNRLGGSVIGFASPEVSRAGGVFAETVEDTARMAEIYADIIVIRHPDANAPVKCAEAANIPVISAGAGATSVGTAGILGEHPTQALLDLYTIKKEKGKIDGLKILLMGNVTSRASHSIGLGLAKFNTHVYLLSPEVPHLSKVLRESFDDAGLSYGEISRVEDVISEVDVIHIVSSRIATKSEKTEDRYRIDLNKLKKAKEGLIILHPLPRLDELPTEIDNTPYAKYFAQARNGLPVRMALLALISGKV